jgi:hypothetical protein
VKGTIRAIPTDRRDSAADTNARTQARSPSAELARCQYKLRVDGESPIAEGLLVRVAERLRVPGQPVWLA